MGCKIKVCLFKNWLLHLLNSQDPMIGLSWPSLQCPTGDGGQATSRQPRRYLMSSCNFSQPRRDIIPHFIQPRRYITPHFSQPSMYLIPHFCQPSMYVIPHFSQPSLYVITHFCRPRC
jgi:hypothetical protein